MCDTFTDAIKACVSRIRLSYAFTDISAASLTITGSVDNSCRWYMSFAMDNRYAQNRLDGCGGQMS